MFLGHETETTTCLPLGGQKQKHGIVISGPPSPRMQTISREIYASPFEFVDLEV